ncbi:MAG: Hsp70 family protein [Myxococcales bacterium]|nr:Hsp70 family protein [Myxococcales bacterium]MBL0197906.1 Hsp70 family protein [Myxococcales bacterium]
MSVVGIDLGTTNTVVASMRAGRVNVLADETGQRLLPSVVSFHPNGEVLVGGPARARRAMDPRNTVASHKRLLGRSWNSPEIVQARARVPYELREGPAQGPLVHARGKDYTLPEISAFVLKRAKQIAETALGGAVQRAVITVPAHFNELQRASTKVAGRVSGLEVLRILNEPTAAALAYGLGRVGSERIAVYDFGGGTFDCTLLDLNNNVFEVLATAGDTFLGGDDVDAAIAERMAEKLLKQHRVDANTDPGVWERLRAAAEELKITLSTRDNAQVTVGDLGYGVGGAALSLQYSLSRGELDQVIQPLVERTFRVTQDALGLARLTPTSFDKVVLVGGSSRIPLVRRRVEAFFGAPPMDRINPDEVVAMGAAIQASALTEGAGKRPIPAPPGVPSAKPQTLRGLQSEEFTSTQMKMPSAPAYARSGSAPPPIGRTDSAPPSNRSLPAAPASTRNVVDMSSAAIHDVKRDDEPSIPSFPGAAVPPHSEFYDSITAAKQREAAKRSTDEFTDSGWTEDEPTMAGSHPPPANPELPLALQSGGFGALDEPPSLVSSVSAVGLTHVPSFSDYEDSTSATEAVPGGTFGEVRDLSLISSSGVSSPGTVPGVPASWHDTASSPEPHTSQQAAAPSPGMSGAPPESTPRVPFGPMSDLGKAPADPKKRTDPYGPFEGKRTAAMSNAPPLPKAAPPPAKAPHKTTDPFGDRAPAEARRPPPAPPAAPAGRAAPPAPPAQPAPARGVGVGAGGGASAFAGASGAYPAQGSGQYPAEGSGPYPAVTPDYPIQHAVIQSAPPPAMAPPAAPPISHQPPPMPGLGSTMEMHAAPPLPQGFAPTMQPMQPPVSYGAQAPMGYGPPAQAPMGYGPPAQAPMGYGPPAQPAMGYGQAPAQGRPYAPVLVDVTPRALVVETAGGFCDTVIPRNAKIPCERTRKFSTGRDQQTVVRVRVAQGEHSTFTQNTYLGEVELSGLRPAGRGEVTVAVTFELDADGTLNVRASDSATGHEARASLRLLGVADEESVLDMVHRMGKA